MSYKKLLSTLNDQHMGSWASLLQRQLLDCFSNIKHGDYSKWQRALETLPDLKPSSFEFAGDAVCIGNVSDCSADQQRVIRQQLRALMPWRKGPFSLFDISIDTEWRSNLKWDRLKHKISPLEGKMVLDIGCGNGYYGWRMLAEKAKYVVGLDPGLIYLMQFLAIKKYLPNADIDILPFGIECLDKLVLNFDTIFSMGVIYHRRDPIAHLQQLLNSLKAGGQLVLESLIVNVDQPLTLDKKDRYAKMRNVWCIPNQRLLIDWAEQLGFVNVEIIDVTVTSLQEQRKTDWMRFESLIDFLDKDDRSKTIEGHPAPTRAILLANKPSL